MTPTHLLFPDDELPVYTVLLPVYHEPEIVQNLLGGIGKLNYPPDKLEVLLLTEEDDTTTHRALVGRPIAPVRVIVVPEHKPKTKPAACNYGMSLPGLKGEMVTIYDAEDIPDPLQLRRAVVALRRAPVGVACLQARLCYFNERQNLLTRWFTLEYDQWFAAILPAVAAPGCGAAGRNVLPPHHQGVAGSRRLGCLQRHRGRRPRRAAGAIRLPHHDSGLDHPRRGQF